MECSNNNNRNKQRLNLRNSLALATMTATLAISTVSSFTTTTTTDCGNAPMTSPLHIFQVSSSLSPLLSSSSLRMSSLAANPDILLRDHIETTLSKATVVDENTKTRQRRVKRKSTTSTKKAVQTKREIVLPTRHLPSYYEDEKELVSQPSLSITSDESLSSVTTGRDTRMMFKRISTTPDRGAKRPQLSRQRRINVTAASATTALAEAFSEVQQKEKLSLTKSESSKSSSVASTSLHATSTSTRTSGSRSSTMPGFQSRKQTGKYRAHQDGLSIVYASNSSTKIRKTVEKQTKKDESKRSKANSDNMYAASASVPDSLIQFTNEIHRTTSRITPSEEIELGTKTQEAMKLQQLYDNLESKYNREPTDEEWCAAAGKMNMEALRQTIEEGMDAKNQLVSSNLRMVQGVVNLYIRNGLGSQYNAGDLMQEGTVALIRAAEKFEPKRGFRFSTYAMYWIRAAVKRSQILQSRVINVPQRIHETHKKLQTVEKDLQNELGRKPNREELAMAMGITETQLERCITAMSQTCYSLDAPIQNTLKPGKDDKNGDTMYDLVECKVDDSEYQKLQRSLMKDHLVDTIKRYLSPHEVDILLLRYGLMDERTLPHGFSGPLTIAEVSRLVGLKPDKVRRMINNSLRHLRPLIAAEWEDFESVLE